MSRKQASQQPTSEELIKIIAEIRALPPTEDMQLRLRLLAELAALLAAQPDEAQTAARLQEALTSHRACEMANVSGQGRDPGIEREAVIAKAVDVIGDEQQAMRWLGTPVRALDYATPVSRLGDQQGQADVLRVLTQLEHGVL